MAVAAVSGSRPGCSVWVHCRGVILSLHEAVSAMHAMLAVGRWLRGCHTPL